MLGDKINLLSKTDLSIHVGIHLESKNSFILNLCTHIYICKYMSIYSQTCLSLGY